MLVLGAALCANLAQAQSPAAPEKAELQTPDSYRQALQSMAQDQLDQAEQQLQETLRTHPEWAGAWLDLAVLFMRQNRYPQAQEILIIMAQKFSPLPEGIRQAFAQLNTQIEQQLQTQDPTLAAVTTASQTAILLAAGYDSNANAGLHTSLITLTLPNAGTTSLPVDSASQAQSAAYTRIGLSRHGQDHWGHANITWQIQAQARQNQGLSTYDSLEVLPQIAMTHPKLSGQITAAWQSVWLHGQTAYRGPMLRWQHSQGLAQCQWQNHLQFEDRQYPQANHLDTHWHAYRSTWDCKNNDQRSQVHLQIAHEEAATAQRPGGNTRHHGLGLQHEWFNVGGLSQQNLQLRLDLSYAKDSQSYNSLLDNGRHKQLQRTDFQATWSAPMQHPSTWRWSISLNINSQKSNIELFKKYSKTLELGYWHAW